MKEQAEQKARELFHQISHMPPVIAEPTITTALLEAEQRGIARVGKWVRHKAWCATEDYAPTCNCGLDAAKGGEAK